MAYKARSNTGSGSGVTSFNTRTGAVVPVSGDYTAAQVTGALVNTNNLSDVSSASTSRTNLGLGTAATLAASAVAQTANNLSDLASASTARTNLGLGTAATLASTAVLQAANNLSDLASASTARTNLGLGSIATLSSNTALQFSQGSTTAGANQTVALTTYAPFAGTINSMKQAQTVSGSITANIQIAGSSVTGLSAVSITSTPGDTAASAANTFAAGQRITVIFTSNSSAMGVEFSLNVTRTS